MLYKIGDFSSKSGLPITTLRYYDEIGLLKPVKVDEFSGYRYYADYQLNDVQLIKTLINCGFSLDKLVGLWGQITTANLESQKEVIKHELIHLQSQINTLDYLIDNSKDFGFAEESLEHSIDKDSVKVLGKTPTKFKH
ncbi:MAG: MerR family transcriptional regulator [Bacilli bacterium]|nr:MerR family transcriptional regulator [Bacilli bacterium]